MAAFSRAIGRATRRMIISVTSAQAISEATPIRALANRAFCEATWITEMFTSAPTVAVISSFWPRIGAAAVFSRPHCTWNSMGET